MGYNFNFSATKDHPTFSLSIEQLLNIQSELLHRVIKAKEDFIHLSHIKHLIAKEQHQVSLMYKDINYFSYNINQLFSQRENLIHKVNQFKASQLLYIDKAAIDTHNKTLHSFMEAIVSCCNKWQQHQQTSRTFKNHISLTILKQSDLLNKEQVIPLLQESIEKLHDLIVKYPKKNQRRKKWGKQVCNRLKEIQAIVGSKLNQNQQLLFSHEKLIKSLNDTYNHLYEIDQAVHKQSLIIEQILKIIFFKYRHLNQLGEEIKSLDQKLFHSYFLINFLQIILNQQLNLVNLQHPIKKLISPVYIKEIVVTQSMDLRQYGIDATANPIDDIIAKLDYLIKLATDNSNYISANVITRLTTDEFSFYTKSPLSLKEYSQVLNFLFNKLEKLPENFHFIFSSFAVLDQDQKVRNVVIHAQSGKAVIIHHSAKAVPSKVDPRFEYPLAKCSYIEASTDSPLMTEVIKDQDIQFGYGSIVHCKSLSGTEFFTNIEICFETFIGHGKNNLFWAIEEFKQDKKLIPTQYSHILTSRVAQILPFDQGHQSVLQADAYHAGFWSRTASHRFLTASPYESVKIISGPFAKSPRKVTIFPVHLVPSLPGSVHHQAKSHNTKMITVETRNII